MYYATQGGGKFLRSYLVKQFAELGDVKDEVAVVDTAIVDTGVALELIHSYSLVHDDLPAMDNGLWRRGRPSCWVAFGDATAILVGDALLTAAFDVLSSMDGVSDYHKINLINLFAKASGANGMIAGQMMDLFPGDLNAITPEQITTMQTLKTGKLFAAACEAGVLLGNHPELRVTAKLFGEQLGVLYQMTDDLLDVLGDQHTVGKTVNHDQHKITFITIFGLESIKSMVADLNDKLHLQIREKFSDYQNLHMLLDMMINRDGGRACG
jgi:geranylgeranyl pyrophosphate synthase